MCLAVPAEVKSIDKLANMATVETFGVRKNVALDLVELDDIHIGDFVMVHVGFVLRKVDMEQAQKTLELHQEIIHIENQP